MIAETQFNRPTLNCMVALRRRLKQTMGVTIQMGQPQALENMIRLSQTCPDADVQALGQQLVSLITPPQETQPAATSSHSLIESMRERLMDEMVTIPREEEPVLRYRGQIVQRS